MSVAILALSDGRLTVQNDARQVQVALQPGLHLFTWCVSNMLFCGFPLAWPADQPQVNCGEFTISVTEPDQVTWMPLAASFRRMRVPGPRSYVFPLEESPPSLVGCFYAGPCPNPFLAARRVVRLETYLPAATIHHVYLSCVQAGVLINVD